ncbi:MAG: TonB-dependent receptor, partial [Balneolaceae bacterium]
MKAKLNISAHVKTHIISALVCFALFISNNLKAQSTGTITGTVVDAETGETLIGVNVVIEETFQGTSTDLDGQFQIRNIKPGTYTLIVSYVSFQRQIITGVEVEAGKTTKLDLAIRPETENLGDVLVTAEVVRNNEAGLLRERQKSLAFSDAISIETISKTGGSNAADALSKVTGASVVGGKYVYVRGLGDRYNNSQLNGVNLPSADPDKNATQFDLFPANLLSSIVTTKTFTPDQPGNFTGGNIDIRTKNYPDYFTLSLSSSVAFNIQSSFTNELLIGESSSTDMLGFDSNRGIPDIVKEADFNIPKYSSVLRDPEGAAFLNEVTRSFGSEIIPEENDAFTTFSNGITFGNYSQVFGNKLGYIFSLNYGQNVSHYQDAVSRSWVATDPNANELATDYNFTDQKSDLSANWGLLTNVSYQLNNKNEVSFRYLSTQDGISTGRIQNGPFIKNTQSENVIFETYVTKYVERNINSFQLSGKHALSSSNKIKVEWDVSTASTHQYEPNLRFFFHEYSEISNPDTTFRNYSINLGSSNATLPTRIFRNLDETNQQLNLDVEIPITLGLSRDMKFKAGGSYLTKERDFSEYKFDYNFGRLRYRDFNGDINAFFAEENMGVIDTTNSGIFRFGHTISNASVPSNNYTGNQTITAGYSMIELPLLKRLTFVGGARIEATDMETISSDSTKSPGNISKVDILPSVNLIYNVLDNMNFRIAASQTLGRPTFREFAPFQAFDFAGGRVTAGNPNLERTLIQNYDFRWEWFMRPGEILAMSVFYKNFSNPIERVMVSNNFQETYQNVNDAQVYGVEMEARSRLDWISEKFRFFMVSANLALTESKVDVPQRELEFAEGFDISTSRPFQGQSPYIFNVSAYYENPELGLNSSISFNRFGNRLQAVGIGGTPNIFEEGRNDLYLSLSKKFFDHLNVKASIDNLLNAPYRT